MASKEAREVSAAIYDDATERLRIVREDAVKNVRDAMSATPGWQAAAKAAAAHAVLVATRNETEAMVTRVLEAHIDAGERNPEAVARDVRERLLSELTAPGLELFEGAAAEAATLKPVALRHAAEFESWRDALSAGVVDRFRNAQASRENTVPFIATSEPSPFLRMRPAVLVFLVVTAAMSLCGFSWLDLVRTAFAR